MFTGNYHRATWDICEPIRADFLFLFFFCFVFLFVFLCFNVKSCGTCVCCQHKIAFTSHGFTDLSLTLIYVVFLCFSVSCLAQR